jgi:hypothetical protein
VKQVDQHIRKSVRSKDGLVFHPAHNPKVVSSNLTSTTRNYSVPISSEYAATIRIDSPPDGNILGPDRKARWETSMASHKPTNLA